jgi:ferredoxin-NADP reductase
MRTARHATVTEISEIASNVLQLTLAIHDPEFRFQPGQYINLRFPEGVSRAYTIASAPERPEAVQLCVRLGSGRGAAALRSLQAGTEIVVEGPFGAFILPEEEREVIFLAGDTGIAPVRSIVLHMLAGGDPRPITVLYEPDEKSILYAADFDPLAREGKIRHESGKIEVLIERNRKALLRSRLMIAGFDAFLARVQECFEKHGIHFDDAIVETFGALP